MVNELKKRDCDIHISLLPSGTQFLCVKMDIQGDHLHFLPSSAVGDQFGDFISALYNLFYEGDDGHDEWTGRHYISDENHMILASQVTVEWDEEHDMAHIVMTRKWSNEIDFESDVMDIEFKRYDKLIKKYTVKTVDFCYAVAKACTEALKRYGFYGYRYSTEHDYFQLHQFLYIKSLALMNFEARELVLECQDEYAKCSSFEKEMELLLFDM